MGNKMSDDIISKNGEVVGEWNGESVEDLKKELLKIKQNLRKQGNKDKVEYLGIPHNDQFPDDLKNFTAYILWAVDKNQNVLVGSGANRIETVESIRTFYANDDAKASIDRYNLED
tara:strand:+ start:309 stop:656 length:348 start_codon:yes stop_codon:yes gene_type:complete